MELKAGVKLGPYATGSLYGKGAMGQMGTDNREWL